MNVKKQSFIKSALSLMSLTLAMAACTVKSSDPASQGSIESQQGVQDPSKKLLPSWAQNMTRHGDLIQAVYEDDKQKVVQLLTAGADINETIGDDNNRITPLLAATMLGRTDIARLLLQNDADLSTTFEGYNALDYAIQNKMDDIAKLIQEKKNYVR